MKIGFDAKRLFFNGSGLGNYSRSLVELVARFEPQWEMLLYSPKPGNRYGFELPANASVVLPRNFWMKKLSSLWRTSFMGRQMAEQKLDIYHGLSHELPTDIARAGTRSVVTIHDLIFVRFPELYKPLDRKLYIKKYRKSCELADRIIAISEQTKNDLVEFWKIDPSKIDVVYQGCDPQFYQTISEQEKERVRREYDLPDGKYILSVGTIEPRKNLLLTVKAMAEGGFTQPLVACGRRTPYQDEILQYAREAGIGHLVHFRNNVRFPDLPAIYQMAGVMTYVSHFEGFGIPILEAMNCGVPVITGKGGVFPETGGDACLYVNADSVGQMQRTLYSALTNLPLREEMIERGRLQALKFREEPVFEALRAVYAKLL